jgi:hypothetical protein
MNLLPFSIHLKAKSTYKARKLSVWKKNSTERLNRLEKKIGSSKIFCSKEFRTSDRTPSKNS